MRLLPDFAWAVATIWQEARGEAYAGKIAVGNVIRNRMAQHGKTAAEIVLAPLASGHPGGMFSGWDPHDPNRIPSALIDDTDPIVKDCANAWIASDENDLVGKATLYCNLDVVTPGWLPNVVKVVQIGHHTFFTEHASA